MTATTRHYSPRASLAALGLRLRRLGLLDAITSTVKVPQKTVRHTQAEKLYDAFVAIPAGAHGLNKSLWPFIRRVTPHRSRGS